MRAREADRLDFLDFVPFLTRDAQLLHEPHGIDAEASRRAREIADSALTIAAPGPRARLDGLVSAAGVQGSRPVDRRDDARRPRRLDPVDVRPGRG